MVIARLQQITEVTVVIFSIRGKKSIYSKKKKIGEKNLALSTLAIYIASFSWIL